MDPQDDKAQQAVELFRLGKTYREIMTELHMGNDSISRALKQAGIVAKSGPKRAPIDPEKVRQWYREGQSTAFIARQCHCARKTIREMVATLTDEDKAEHAKHAPEVISDMRKTAATTYYANKSEDSQDEDTTEQPEPKPKVKREPKPKPVTYGQDEDALATCLSVRAAMQSHADNLDEDTEPDNLDLCTEPHPSELPKNEKAAFARQLYREGEEPKVIAKYLCVHFRWVKKQITAEDTEARRLWDIANLCCDPTKHDAIVSLWQAKQPLDMIAELTDKPFETVVAHLQERGFDTAKDHEARPLDRIFKRICQAPCACYYCDQPTNNPEQATYDGMLVYVCPECKGIIEDEPLTESEDMSEKEPAQELDRFTREDAQRIAEMVKRLGAATVLMAVDMAETMLSLTDSK